MRRWYIGCGAVAVLSVVAALLLSRGQAQETKNADKPQASKLAKSRIDKVTVYTTNALVTREVEVPEGTGLVELVVNPMPAQIVPSTLYSEGGSGLRVLTTRFTTRQVYEDTSEERRKLEAEKEKYQVLGTKIDSEMSSLQKNMALLVKLEQVTEKGKHTGDEVIAMAKYVMEQRVEKAKEMVALQDQKRLNDIQLGFIQRKMGELGGTGGKVEREAIIVVDRVAGKGGTIRLNYLVGAVAWRPEYKVRAGKSDEDVKVDYLANLMQHSGEDWNRVDMTLSTAQPLLNASPPELGMLQPILVMRGAPGGVPMPSSGPAPFANKFDNKELQNKANMLRDQAGMNYRSGKSVNLEAAQKQLNDAAAWEQNLELMCTREELLAQLSKGNKGGGVVNVTDGPSITYHLPAKLTVPSRGDEQVIEVVKLKLAPKYYYKTVPVLNTRVYRLADLVNKSEYVLLPGEATMYQGTDFVGRMPMPLVAVGEEFTAGFGVDTQLQVQRQMVDQTRTTAGGNQVLKYDYRILISNFKKDPVQLQVWDRLPKGETESVGVVLLKSTPELSKEALYVRESRPNNLLRWDVTVPANCSGEKAFAVNYEFRMELDRQMAITGFRSK